MSQTSANIALLKSFPLFGALNHSALESLAKKMAQGAYTEGEVIFHFNAVGDRLYFIVTGEVEFFHTAPSGEPLEPINPVGPGHFFGEVALLTGGRRTMSARARRTTTTLELNKEDFRAFLRHYPDAAYGLLQDMAERLRVSGYMLRYTPHNVNLDISKSRLDNLFHGIARMCGHLLFILIHIVFFAVWVLYNTHQAKPLDPFPFPLLSLFVSTEALLIVCVVLGSETRQAETEFARNEEEYRANVNSAQATFHLVEMVEELQHTVSDLKRQAQQPTQSSEETAADAVTARQHSDSVGPP
jgi:CRP-like cAMP-binding protein